MQAFAEFPYLGLTKGHCNDITTVRETSGMVTAEEDRDGYANRYLLDLRGLNVLELLQRGLPRCIGSPCCYKTMYEAKKKVCIWR